MLNTINFAKSMHYNPLAYIRSEKDILKLVNTIIANTKGEGNQSGEDFWVKAERLYYCALIGYIWYEAPEEEQNLNTLIEMINASEAREDDENFENPIDVLFKELEERNPDHFAVRQYLKYNLAAGYACNSFFRVVQQVGSGPGVEQFSLDVGQGAVQVGFKSIGDNGFIHYACSLISRRCPLRPNLYLYQTRLQLHRVCL